jgi:hypothetical protein
VAVLARSLQVAGEYHVVAQDLEREERARERVGARVDEVSHGAGRDRGKPAAVRARRDRRMA